MKKPKKSVVPIQSAAQALGRLGGKARARALSDERKREIARQGGKARWKGRRQTGQA